MGEDGKRVESFESNQNMRVDSGESNEKKRVRDQLDESEHDSSPEVKRLRDDLLSGLDDSDPDPASQDLDSVIKSFQDELSTAVCGSGETQPDLGYLLEASDDELGLPPPPPPPPPTSTAGEETELVRVSSDSSGIGEELWGFVDQITSYDSFELGIATADDGYGGSGGAGYVAVDGLFEYSDVFFDSVDTLTWRPETLPAE